MENEKMKPKSLAIVISMILVMASVIILPKLLSKKPAEQSTDEEPVATQRTLPRQESFRFEVETQRQKTFEELSPEEKAMLYAQAQVDVSQNIDDAVQTAIEEALRQQRATQPAQQANLPRPANTNLLPSSNFLPVPMEYAQDNETQKLLNKEFTAANQFFRSQTEQGRWAMSRGEYTSTLQRSNNIVKAVDIENLNLFDLASIISKEINSTIPSGTYLSGITTGITDSDYPEYLVVNMTRPATLRGYKLLMKSSSNNAGRIFMSTDRLISPEGKEIPISGQVEMASIPGMTGDKRSRWFKRMAPSMINAGIGGGLLYWSMLEEQRNRDAMIAAGGGSASTAAITNPVTQAGVNTNEIITPMIQDGIGGFQKEITRAFQQGNLEDQVIIREGTTFDILLLAPLKI